MLRITLILFLLLVGCESPTEAEVDENIVGFWNLLSSELISFENDTTITQEEYSYADLIFVFKENGELDIIEESEYEASMPYSISNDSLLMDGFYYNMFFLINEDSLTLSWGAYNEGSMTYFFQRIADFEYMNTDEGTISGYVINESTG